MVDIDEAEKLLKEKRKERTKHEKELERWTELNKMSWIKRLQEPEFKEQLRRLEQHQEEAWHVKMKEKHPKEYEKELKELFGMFFTDLLNEKCKNMIDWYNNIWKQQNHK